MKYGPVAVAALAWLVLALLAPAGAGVVSLPVPRVTIYPGDPVTPDLLRQRRFRQSAVRTLPVARLPQDVAGKVAKRTLLRGKLIPLHALREPHVVSKGQQVRVIYASGGLVITALATTLRSGAVGEVVPARNVDSGKLISGTVTLDGSLRLRRP